MSAETISRGVPATPGGSLPEPEIRYVVGDYVYALVAIDNDGGVPEIAAEARLAESGTRGVVVQVGHAEADPRRTVYAVRFEDERGELGQLVGCLPEELTQDAPSSRPGANEGTP